MFAVVCTLRTDNKTPKIGDLKYVSTGHEPCVGPKTGNRNGENRKPKPKPWACGPQSAIGEWNFCSSARSRGKHCFSEHCFSESALQARSGAMLQKYGFPAGWGVMEMLWRYTEIRSTATATATANDQPLIILRTLLLLE